MLKLRYDDTNDLHRPNATVAQALCKHIGVIIMLPGIFLNLLALLSTDARTVLQRPGDGSDRDTQCLGYILHCDGNYL